MKTECGPLFVGESGAFVEDGCIKKIHTAKAHVKGGNVHSYLRGNSSVRQLLSGTSVAYRSPVSFYESWRRTEVLHNTTAQMSKDRINRSNQTRHGDVTASSVSRSCSAAGYRASRFNTSGGNGIRESFLHFLGNRLTPELDRVFAYAHDPYAPLKYLQAEDSIGQEDSMLDQKATAAPFGDRCFVDHLIAEIRRHDESRTQVN